jgi:hypothetical protein
VNATHPGAAAAIGIEEEGHQRAQHCRRWQRTAGMTASTWAREEGARMRRMAFGRERKRSCGPRDK